MAQFDGRVSTQAYGNALSRSGSAIVNGTYALRQERKLDELTRQNYDMHSILKDGRAEDVQRCESCISCYASLGRLDTNRSKMQHRYDSSLRGE